MTLKYTAFIYEEHLTPKGLLPREIKERSSAAWHFARLALTALEKVPEQVTLEGDTDRTVPLLNLARSVATMYGIKEIGDFLCLMDFVQAEAVRTGLPWNDRLTAWVASGGRAYNFVTREEGALNQQ